MTFDPINDPSFPFPDFASNDEAYVASRLFWETGFEEVVEGPRGWRNWMPDPFKDGHPIFSKFDPDRRRGILLQQVPQADDPIWFKCWLSEISDSDENYSISYLFVETSVSARARDLFQRLVRDWCVREVSVDRMKQLTDHVRTEVIETSRAPDIVERVRH